MRFSLKYGMNSVDFEFNEKNVLSVIEPNVIAETNLSDEEVIINALKNPIQSKKIEECVKPGQKIAIAIGDKSRLWQKQYLMVKIVVGILNSCGIKDEDITIISAKGAHPHQDEKDIIATVGEEIYQRINVIEHDCNDYDNMVYVGTTKRGTEVIVNKTAYEADYLIILGGVVYHYMAGFGGGRKMILPGLSSKKTINANHIHGLGKEIGSGSNPEMKNGVMDTNPIAEDMLEAAKFVNPDFLLNVVVNDDGKITHAFAGDFIEAHRQATEIIKKRDSVTIDELADMVIISGGGFPKDINLYQSTKPMVNASAALKDNGIMILLHEDRDGIDNPEVELMLKNFDNNVDREIYLRNNYTIGKNIGFTICEFASKYNLILVSSIDKKEIEKTDIKLVRSIDEAIEMAYQIKGTADIKTIIMPYGSNTFPVLKEKKEC